MTPRTPSSLPGICPICRTKPAVQPIGERAFCPDCAALVRRTARMKRDQALATMRRLALGGPQQEAA